MRIIKESRVRDYAKRHARAVVSLENWLTATRAALWSRFVDVTATYRSADQVIVGSGKPVVVFNIAGGKFRLITAIHYNRSLVYVLDFLTHADYSKGDWKDRL